MLGIMFMLPIIQLIILVNAATLEMKHIKTTIVDNDQSTTSRQIVNKFQASPFFQIKNRTFSIKEAEDDLKDNTSNFIIHIPAGFEKKLIRENKSTIQLLINSIDGMAAGLVNAYTLSILAEYNKQLITEWIDVSKANGQKNIDITYSYWYNPELNYKTFMVPGILVLLTTIIGMFLTGLNLVREKEMGTIEQINVTPIKKYQFIVGKLIPFMILALTILGIGLSVGKLLYDIPIVGSLPLLFFVAAVYLLAILSIGLFISTISNTQQQLMFVAFFFLIVFILMSGIFTSTESMPEWAQWVNIINPIAYFMKIIRMVILKGSGFAEVMSDVVKLFIYGVIMLSLSVWRYKKTT